MIYGHSHQYAEVWQESVVRNRTLLFNPGSCGPRRFIQPITMAILRIDPDGWGIEQVRIPHSPREKTPKVDSGNIYRQIEVDGIMTKMGLLGKL